MIIVLMRHGEASYDAPNDDVRQLTEKGRERIRHNFSMARTHIGQPSGLYSSPILRARQTAELVRDLLGDKQAIVQVNWLIHETRPLEAIVALGKLAEPSVMLFSHQPLASRLAECLCGREAGEISMSTASIIAMEVDPVAAGFGKVLWRIA